MKRFTKYLFLLLITYCSIALPAASQSPMQKIFDIIDKTHESLYKDASKPCKACVFCKACFDHQPITQKGPRCAWQLQIHKDTLLDMISGSATGLRR